MARSVFHGTAATTFNTAAHGLTETNDNFATVMNTVTRSIFPLRTVQTQKRYMRRFLRKPKDIGIREHVARVTELNEYFEEYIKIRRKLSRVIEGLNATTGPQKYVLARSIFHGTAATTFNSAAHGLTETLSLIHI